MAETAGLLSCSRMFLEQGEMTNLARWAMTTTVEAVSGGSDLEAPAAKMEWEERKKMEEDSDVRY